MIEIERDGEREREIEREGDRKKDRDRSIQEWARTVEAMSYILMHKAAKRKS